VYKRNPTRIYNERYYRRHLEKYRDWERGVAIAFTGLFPIKSVVDFGCGVGSYLEGFVEAGVRRVQGYEYAFEASRKYTPAGILPRIQYGDLTTRMDVRVFECAWSVEVAEHLPLESSDTFVENLCRASTRYVFLTAAPPGQAGTGHINCQPQEFWISKFDSRDFAYRQDLMPKLWEIIKSVTGVPRYIRKNAMFFEKRR